MSLLSFIISSVAFHAFGQDTIVKLWKDVDGAFEGKQRRPELRVFYPKTANTGTCMLICPGGSYHHLALKSEGKEVAEWFANQGVTAFVLRYRVGYYGNHQPAMIEDFQRAMQIIRQNADFFHINPDKVGAIGFSAGGHLVTHGGILADSRYLKAKGIDCKVSTRPNFVVPVYPVVSMQDSIVHQRSRKNLLTEHYTKELQDRFSLELQIPADMPPVFLVACKDDPVVDYRNSVVLHKAMKNKNIPITFFLFNEGGHGFGVARTKSDETKDWNLKLLEWMKENNFITQK